MTKNSGKPMDKQTLETVEELVELQKRSLVIEGAALSATEEDTRILHKSMYDILHIKKCVSSEVRLQWGILVALIVDIIIRLVK